jgi:ATPase subunit of ABC transporter with duplicated ATPase domains
MAGIDTDFTGEAWPGENITVGYLEQEPELDPTKTVLENVKDGAREIADKLDRFNEISMIMADPPEDVDFDALMEEMGTLQEKIDAVDGWTLDNQLEIAMEALRCPPGDWSVDKLSGGEKRRIALTRLLIQKALDPAARRADQPSGCRERRMAGKSSEGICGRGTDDHPRPLFPRQCGRLDPRARSRKILPLRGQLLHLSGEEGQAAGAGRARGIGPPEGDQGRAGVDPAGPERPPDQIQGAYRQVRATVAAQENRTPGKAQIVIQVPERLGGKVIEVKNISKAYGDKLLFEDLSFTLPPGGIVGVIGPNGAGKSTLFKILTGKEKPDTGSVEIGSTVHLGYVDQSRDHLDGSKNVWEEISDGLDYMKVNGHDMSTRAYVGAFNFKGQDQQKNVGKLSGGERNRVHMAKMLKTGGNVLLLDEPTNDLDVETLGALEDAIENFAGCAVVISHDRFFLDRLATHILAFEGNSHVEWFEGNFESYEEDKRRRLGDAADRPTSLAYKKLTR